MTDEAGLKQAIKKLLSDYSRLSNPSGEAEKRTEEFLRPLLEAMGWRWLTDEVRPQNVTKSGFRTTRVDYCLKRSGEIRPSFYLEVKRFSNDLENPKDITQAIEYGKNGGVRWVVLTNFVRWRVFNSDYFDDIKNAELLEFRVGDCVEDAEKMGWLLMLSNEMGGAALDEYARKHKKWKESESVEELLTEQLVETREVLSKALREQNPNLFDTEAENEDFSLDACVQWILNRIIFSRMAEDNGAPAELRMKNVIERWEADRRRQLYRDHVSVLWETRMRKSFDSNIFDKHRIDGLNLKNEDFAPVVESFYRNKKTGLSYHFDIMPADVLGHAYENYLSYTTKQTPKRTGLEKGLYKRKQGGIYYTPNFLVDFLVHSTVGEALKSCKSADEALKLRILDPACGSGTFLVSALDEFRQWFISSSQKGDITIFLCSVLEQCIYGIDIDPNAVRLAKLNLFLRAMSAPRKLPQLNIIKRNSLLDGNERFQNHAWGFVPGRDFPLVHEKGGFDIVIGNPPWEKWKPDSQEFFEYYEPGFKSLPTQKAKKRMEELLKRTAIRGSWEMKLIEWRTFSDFYRQLYSYQSAEAGKRSVSGDLDLYKLFTERARMLLKDGGVAGLVVPSGIYTDLGAKGLRAMLFDHSQVKALYSFENRGHAIFPDVHASYKPVLLVFQKGGRTRQFPCAFFLHSDDDLKEAVKNPTIMDIDFVKKSSPTSWGVLEIKSAKDYDIVQKLLKFPPLGEKVPNSWNIEMQSGFHMTNDSHLFKSGVLMGVPMLEGKNIHQFTHRWVEAPTPRYKIFEKDLQANWRIPIHKECWLGFRRIARSTDNRTLITTIIPPGYCCAESITFNANKLDEKVMCYLCGVLNSFTLDYFIRQKVSANINMFHFMELPVPRLSSGKDFEAIARKAAQLVCTTKEFDGLKKEMDVEGITDENGRALARAQLDAMVAKLYGLTKEELAYILEKFPIVEEKQKDLVLREY